MVSTFFKAAIFLFVIGCMAYHGCSKQSKSQAASGSAAATQPGEK